MPVSGRLRASHHDMTRIIGAVIVIIDAMRMIN